MADDETSWHLDKRVPVVIILAIILQTSGAVWWAATTSQRLSAVEAHVLQAGPQQEKLVRVETMIGTMREDITEIKTILRRSYSP